MKEKTIVSCLTLLSSLSCYAYARTHSYDAVPFTMVGGFIGAMLSEVALSLLRRKK